MSLVFHLRYRATQTPTKRGNYQCVAFVEFVEETSSDKMVETCMICEKEFNSKSHLKQHLLIHNGEKSFQCEYCEKKFTRKWSLNTHVKIHTGERALKCEYCEKKFNRKEHLKRHLTIHTEKSSKNPESNE